VRACFGIVICAFREQPDPCESVQQHKTGAHSEARPADTVLLEPRRRFQPSRCSRLLRCVPRIRLTPKNPSRSASHPLRQCSRMHSHYTYSQRTASAHESHERVAIDVFARTSYPSRLIPLGFLRLAFRRAKGQVRHSRHDSTLTRSNPCCAPERCLTTLMAVARRRPPPPCLLLPTKCSLRGQVSDRLMQRRAPQFGSGLRARTRDLLPAARTSLDDGQVSRPARGAPGPATSRSFRRSVERPPMVPCSRACSH